MCQTKKHYLLQDTLNTFINIWYTTLSIPLSVCYFSLLVAEEPLIREAEIPIPDDVATKKSFTVKPPADKPATSTIGILFLDVYRISFFFIVIIYIIYWHPSSSASGFYLYRLRKYQNNKQPRWTLQQIYVSKVINENSVCKTNKKGGSTISVRRRGGWKASYNLAVEMAGWAKET